MKATKVVITALAATLLTLTSPLSFSKEPKAPTAIMEKVNINQADATQLSQRLYGVGLAKAKAIVAYRTQHGKFKTLKDLEKVKGIGAATLARNKDFIQL